MNIAKPTKIDFDVVKRFCVYEYDASETLVGNIKVNISNLMQKTRVSVLHLLSIAKAPKVR